ncbi:hypothetical protein, partial [Yersinia pseudotuberculosis]|uniref:hypothetical protein n=1 Tax=Yersinia pseudotuberculosis TaxID=633 RepID=UPI001C62C7C9
KGGYYQHQQHRREGRERKLFYWNRKNEQSNGCAVLLQTGIHWLLEHSYSLNIVKIHNLIGFIH